MSSHIANSGNVQEKDYFFFSIKNVINLKYIIFFVCCDKWNDLHACLWAFNLYCFYSFSHRKILRLWQDCNFPTWFLHHYVSILCVLIFLSNYLDTLKWNVCFIVFCYQQTQFNKCFLKIIQFVVLFMLMCFLQI